jgi:hypothetical protein
VRRRDFLSSSIKFAALSWSARMWEGVSFAGEGQAARNKMVGMYIHEGWPYNHPYAARTWTLEDYRGYADGLRKMGFNTLIIWPALEIMPDPLTSSDRANIIKTEKVIDMLHTEFRMKAYLTLCPNIVAENRRASRYTFERRPLFSYMHFVNPADHDFVKRMIDWREKLLRPLAKMDGIAIIDSDPGGYPGSNNQQFANLLEAHRKMLNRLRPGIELCYWMHVGWEGYCRFYATGKFTWGTPAEARDILRRLKALDLDPWQITIHTMEAPPNGTDLALAEEMGLAGNALAFNYGAIEGEPSFPMTNFGGEGAYKAGQAGAPGGVVGNAQTHCVQLPNTFAFVRGARGESLPRESDYAQFAEELIPGEGEEIVRGWQALAGKDAGAMRKRAGELERVMYKELRGGRLQGLLFGSPQRFLSDLVMELRMRAAYTDFLLASGQNQDVKKAFQAFLKETKEWQGRTGYQSLWVWPDLNKALRKLNSPRINRMLDSENFETINLHFPGRTPFARVQNFDKMFDHATPRLIETMSEVAEESRS